MNIMGFCLLESITMASLRGRSPNFDTSPVMLVKRTISMSIYSAILSAGNTQRHQYVVWERDKSEGEGEKQS